MAPPDTNGNNAGILTVNPGELTLAPGHAGSQFIIARLNADGSIDTTFGSSGFELGTVDDGGLTYQIGSDLKSVVIQTASGPLVLPITQSPNAPVGWSIEMQEIELFTTGVGAVGGYVATGLINGALVDLGITAVACPFTIPVVIGIAGGYCVGHYLMFGTWW